jgi:hypothetical protein
MTNEHEARLTETSVATQMASTASRTAEISSYFVNMFDFRAFCLGFVVHKARVGEYFLQALQFPFQDHSTIAQC